MLTFKQLTFAYANTMYSSATSAYSVKEHVAMQENLFLVFVPAYRVNH